MFIVDENLNIEWAEMSNQGDARFDSLGGLRELADVRGWSKADLTRIWNANAAKLGERDHLAIIRNRPSACLKLWRAAQGLVPGSRAAEELAARLSRIDAEGPSNAVAASTRGAAASGIPRKKHQTGKARKRKAATSRKSLKIKRAKEPRDGSNLARLITLMRRSNGVSIEEAMDKLGWGATHTVRGRISILKSQGMKIESYRDEKRGRIYRAA